MLKQAKKTQTEAKKPKYHVDEKKLAGRNMLLPAKKYRKLTRTNRKMITTK
jgi:hypothetical protein